MDFVLGLSILKNLVVVLFILICFAIVLIILLQKGRGGGLSGAFGGGGAGSLLGTKTGDFLTWVTICLVAAFLVMSVLMGKFLRPSAPGLMPSAPAPMTSQPSTLPSADTPISATETSPADQTQAADETASKTVEDAGKSDMTDKATEKPAESTQ